MHAKGGVIEREQACCDHVPSNWSCLGAPDLLSIKEKSNGSDYLLTPTTNKK